MELESKRKYICVVYDKQSQQLLRDWCIENGFDLTKDYDGNLQSINDFEFHTTIYHTVNEVSVYNQIMKTNPSPVFFEHFESLGENKDIPVIKLEKTGELMHIRNHYTKLGFKDSWDEYKPHISLSYVRKPVDFSKFSLPDFVPTFDKIKIEDIME